MEMSEAGIQHKRKLFTFIWIKRKVAQKYASDLQILSFEL